ncbi:hypothetical protein GQ457_09G024730 [Hibiscus cannabinus]
MSSPQNPNVEEVSTDNGLAVGFKGGRPPDEVVVVDGMNTLERSGSPVAGAVQPLQKRSRNLEEAMIIDDESGKVAPEYFGLVEGGSQVQVAADGLSEPSIPSFKDKLVGSKVLSSNTRSLSDLDVDVKEDDVRIGGSSTLPEIQFSDRVHNQVDAQLAKSVIVRLLGKSIGYRTLMNRVKSLWNPKGDMCIIDLDNDYFLARFALEEDFQKVLSEGPWVIYRSYLTVQPWSRDFSTSEAHPSHIMVCVRLPKLPYRYYTKSMFRHIANAIGKVVKVDYNTSEGKRGRFARLAIVMDLRKPLVSGIVIDGHRQDVEYEGLPEIFFKCGRVGHSKEMWAVWNGREAPAGSRGRIRIASRSPSPKVDEADRFTVASAGGSGTKGDVRKIGASSEVAPLGREPSPVAAQGVVVPVKSALGSDKHAAVQVVGAGEGLNPKPVKSRVLPSSIRGSAPRGSINKGHGNTVNSKLGVKQTKRDDRGQVNPVVHSSLAELVADLDRAEAAVKDSEIGLTDGSEGSDVHRKWRGALDPVVARSFKLLCRSKMPDIVFVHGHCVPLNGEPGFRITFIYASPELGPDHRSIMLDSVARHEDTGCKPFRYLAAWNEHEDFPKMLARSWSHDLSLHENISQFQQQSRKWSVEVFGLINHRKRQLLARLRGIERTLESGPNLYLEELEKALKLELDIVLMQEESLWHQRARNAWIDKGDRNTRFFHLSAMIRKRVTQLKH